MKRHPWISYITCLFIALGLAYWASLPASDVEVGQTSLLSLNPDSISRIEYSDLEHTVVLEREKGTDRFWGMNTKHSQSDDSAEVSVKFLAGSQMSEVLRYFSPLRAVRGLGRIAEDKYEDFGLQENFATMRVFAGSEKKVEFHFGGRSYGSRDRYALDLFSKDVYLMRWTALQKIEKAQTALMEKRLFDSSYDDVSAATFEANGKNKKIMRIGASRGEGAAWVTDPQGGAGNQSYATWFDRLKKVQVISYATEDQASALLSLKPILEIIFVQSSGKLERVAFYKQAVGASGQPTYWVKSSVFGVFAKIGNSRMDVIEKDLNNIFDS